jgi:riboflavin kinase/FMN adenylyltransferase
VRHLVVGYDHRFGHDRSEGFADYVRYGRELGIAVDQWEVFKMRGQNVSSSLIRRYLQEGEVLRAAECLGYYYELAGRVVGGHQMGRKMGFPTANIEADEGKLIPAPGVYAVKAFAEHSALPYKAMMNVGVRPTFGGGDLPLEVQPVFLQSLDASRRLGITLTTSNLMVPTKSVTAFVGIHDGPQVGVAASCDMCSLADTCALRARGVTCA